MHRVQTTRLGLDAEAAKAAKAHEQAERALQVRAHTFLCVSDRGHMCLCCVGLPQTLTLNPKP